MVKTQHYVIAPFFFFFALRANEKFLLSESQRESSTPKFYKHECKRIRLSHSNQGKAKELWSSAWSTYHMAKAASVHVYF